MTGGIFILPSLAFEGTTKVINKGVDITLIADSDSVDFAFGVSRVLSVMGVSAAVLQVTCLAPFDSKTMEYFEQTTRKLIFLTTELLEAAEKHLKADTDAVVAELMEKEIYIKKLMEMIKPQK
ncbi:transketolase C-terminal domain-containing protein [Bacillus sp. B15-48]|uniref:transketolase C-terminal domain-containing protein n=1 Tax=Bacillus sp. B15-48 TaxID=1548601 RepID=UPI0019401A97